MGIVSRWLARGAAPSETFEACEVTIECDPFTAGLDCQRSEIRVRYQVAHRFRIPIQASEYLPMPGTGADRNTLGLTPDHVCELQGFVRGTRADEHARMGDDAEESAQREAESFRSTPGITPVP